MKLDYGYEEFLEHVDKIARKNARPKILPLVSSNLENIHVAVLTSSTSKYFHIEK